MAPDFFKGFWRYHSKGACATNWWQRWKFFILALFLWWILKALNGFSVELQQLAGYSRRSKKKCNFLWNRVLIINFKFETVIKEGLTIGHCFLRPVERRVNRVIYGFCNLLHKTNASEGYRFGYRTSHTSNFT